MLNLNLAICILHQSWDEALLERRQGWGRFCRSFVDAIEDLLERRQGWGRFCRSFMGAIED